VDNKADVWFIEAHAEGYRRDDNFQSILHQKVLQLFPVFVRVQALIVVVAGWLDSCVVSFGSDSLRAQQIGHLTEQLFTCELGRQKPTQIACTQS